MKKLIALYFLLFPLVVSTQSWTKKYFNNSERDENMCCVIQTTDGDFVVAGREIAPTGGGNIFYFKIDAEGALIWERTFSTSFFSGALKMIAEPNGGFIILGSVSGGAIMLADFDENGYQENIKFHKIDIASLLGGFVRLENGDLLISGSNDIDPDPDFYNSKHFLLCLNSNLELKYDVDIDLPGDFTEWHIDLLQIDENHVISSAYISNDTLSVPPKILLLKWDFKEAEFLWFKTLEEGIYTDLILDQGGLSFQAAGLVFDDNLNKECVVHTYDFEGNQIGALDWESMPNCETNAMVQMSDGSFMVSTISINDELFKAQSSLVHLSSDGEELCATHYLEAQQTIPADLIITEAEQIMLLSNALDQNYDHFPIISLLEFPCDQSIIISDIEDQLFVNINLYPNPCDTQLFLESDEALNFNVIISDGLGRQMYSGEYIGPIDIAHLSKGLYYLTLLEGNDLIGSKSFVRE